MNEEQELDVFSMAEGGAAALDELIEKGPPRVARQRRGDNPKTAWKGVCVRMDPQVRGRLKRIGGELGVPFEELVHLALVAFLERVEAGEIEFEPRWSVTRKTLL